MRVITRKPKPTVKRETCAALTPGAVLLHRGVGVVTFNCAPQLVLFPPMPVITQ